MPKLTNKEALRRIVAIHGEKYNYDKFEYRGYSQNVSLICPIHGEFNVVYGDIIHKQRGCPCCSDKRFSIEKFLERARQVHGYKYDYSKVEYVNANTKICIICPKHGEFWQKPSQHLNGNGCPRCYDDKRKGRFLGASERLDTNIFIKRAVEKHGNKYNYSQVEYADYETPVIITCPHHGEFSQRPSVHLRGGGCPQCSKCKHLTTEDFIKRAQEIHGDNYDYSKVDYKNSKEKVCIICLEHGEFWQKPVKHINAKQGCPKCAKNVKFTNSEFIEKVQHLHSDGLGNPLYDYSKCVYTNANSILTIICPKHGEFIQAARDHYWGRKGCPKCNQSQIEHSVQQFLNKNIIEYFYQYRAEWLNMLSLDFFLQDYNIAIECQGRQHFEPTDFSGKGLENAKLLLESQIQRDLKKIELCKEHGITLLHYATCEIPEDFNLYPVITNEEELISTIKTLIENHGNNQRNS